MSFFPQDNIDVSESFNQGQVPVALPREAVLDTVPRSSLAATKKIVNIVPITNNSVGPNQTVQFLIPQRNLAKAHSFYLNFRLQLNLAGSGLTATTTNYYCAFSGLLASAAALINNITIQAGGQLIESLQNYHLWHNNVVCNAMPAQAQGKIEQTAGLAASADYFASKFLASNCNVAGAGTGAASMPGTSLSQTSSGFYSQGGTNPANSVVTAAGDVSQANLGTLAQYAKQFFLGGALASGTSGGSITIDVSIPINAGFFNPKESQFIPLQFINGGVLLTLQTNPVEKALISCSELIADGTATLGSFISSYTMSNLELCYHEIQPSPSYIVQVRTELAAQRRIRIECQSYQNYMAGSGSSVRALFNANLSSLSSLFWGRIIAPDTQSTSKMFQQVTASVKDGAAGARYEIYLDNALIFQSANQLNMISHQVRQLQEAIASSITGYESYFATCGRGNDETNDIGSLVGSNMLWGLSTKLFATNTTSFDGVPVNTLTINFTGQESATTNTWYFFLVYDYIYSIDGMGNIAKDQ